MTWFLINIFIIVLIYERCCVHKVLEQTVLVAIPENVKISIHLFF